ncbi:MAG: DUF421 domain-containing protein [Clostridia bacterium]|nr:DUF421 domain-containing protein [Clostridia bacterium]
MATVFLRTVIIYVLFIFCLRLVGKRQVGELQLSELVTTFMLSELAVNPIQDFSIPIAYAIVPLILLLVFEVIMSFLVTKSNLIKKALFGNPSIIIKDGALNQKELSRLRIGISELLAELRIKGFSDISEIDYAILEQNGKLSVFPKVKNQPITIGDLDIKKKEGGISHPLITDGKINQSNLLLANKTEKWLLSYLKKHSININEVFLLTCNDANAINIIMKGEK